MLLFVDWFYAFVKKNPDAMLRYYNKIEKKYQLTIQRYMKAAEYPKIDMVVLQQCILTLETGEVRQFIFRIMEYICFVIRRIFSGKKFSMTLGAAQVRTQKLIGDRESIALSAKLIRQYYKDGELLLGKDGMSVNARIYMVGYLYNASSSYAWELVNIYNLVTYNLYVKEDRGVSYIETLPNMRREQRVSTAGKWKAEQFLKYQGCCSVQLIEERAAELGETCTAELIREIFWNVNNIDPEDTMRFDKKLQFPHNWVRSIFSPFLSMGENYYTPFKLSQ